MTKPKVQPKKLAPVILPKKVNIIGKEWKVIAQSDRGGGSFDAATYEISIGTKYPKDVPDVLIHEIAEAILTERRLRYKIFFDGDNDGMLFALNHTDFSNFIMDLTASLNSIKALKIG